MTEVKRPSCYIPGTAGGFFPDDVDQNNRTCIAGSLKSNLGAVEVVAGAAAVVAAPGLAKIAGVALFAHGLDMVISGDEQLSTRREVPTKTWEAGNYLFERFSSWKIGR